MSLIPAPTVEKIADAFTVHGEGVHGDVWLRHTLCGRDLPILDDPWTLADLMSLALDHADCTG